MVRFAAILAPPCLFPVVVYLLTRRAMESHSGKGLEMLVTIMLGGVVAMLYGCVALWRMKSQGRSGSWFLGAGIALSPAVYFVLWNAALLPR